MAVIIDSVEELGPRVVADISALVARRLREEYLYHFLRHRDDLLRLERSDDSEFSRLLRSQNLHSLEKTWDSVLETLRSDLPKTLDQLFSNFKPEFQTGGLPSALDVTPNPSTSGPMEIPAVPIPTKAAKKPWTRSTFVLGQDKERSNTDIDSRDSVSEHIDKPSRKRGLDLEEAVVRHPKKRAKRKSQTPGHKLTIKRSILLDEAKNGECIFSYNGYSGLYVLRCKQSQCKRVLKQEGPTIFKSHPFKDGLALDHFRNQPHYMHSEPEIFHKFAIQVTAADAERNTEKKDDSRPGSIVLGEDPPMPATSPPKSRDKGKKPETPYRLSLPRTTPTEATALETSETLKELLYRAGLPSNDGLKSPSVATDPNEM
ncbi:hypothetical protein GGS24DRAFT_452079 [Hypoxylon argillaceum]|nr:hypothetical protein GGS24DRAFT_452079 [Hypoxylon argillaceum]